MTAEMNGSVAVVTGGASGIGEASARLLAGRGTQVAIVDVAEERGRDVAEAIGGAFFRASVLDEDEIEAAAQQIEDQLGPADILVTSAGIAQSPRPPEELAMKTWDRVVDTDLRGTYLSCVAFGRRMALRGRGSIVTIASITGMRATPLHAYGPAKAAVISLTAGLAAEWGRSGVRVNAVSPGYTLTPPMQWAIDNGRRDPTLMEENSALGRLVAPEEVARAVAFLASEDASAITGVNLPVDAGWLTAGPHHTYGGLAPPRKPD